MNHFPSRATSRCVPGLLLSITLGCVALPLNRPAAPVFDPQPGLDACPRVVALQGVQPGAEVYYSTDGSEPSRRSVRYAGPVQIDAPRTRVQAIAYAANGTASEVVSGAFICAPTTLSRARFAASLQQAFALPATVARVPFVDVAPGDASYEAIQAIAPYLHRNVLCPGCRLSLNYLPSDSPTRVEAAVVIVSLLIEHRGVVLMSDSQATSALAGVPDAATLNPLARRFVATAIAQDVLSLDEKGRVRGADAFVMSDFSQVLGALDRKARAHR
jgi:Fn3 domain-containing protein